MPEAVGFIGLGIMGSRQAASLRRAGFELTVYNRTRERAEAWAAEHGGHVAASPREVAERSDVVITMVVDGAQVEETLLGADGAVHGARPGTLFIDMSTRSSTPR
jgi:3-hydroxyisobutyrate dehydrogenase-like beta-hydroxyacid dehydrogenase